MKSLRITLTIVVAVSAMGLTGCLVPKAKLDEAQAANRTLQARLSAAETLARDLEGENMRLNDALASQGGAAAELSMLQSQHSQLQYDYGSLQEQYRLLLERSETPPDIILPQDVSAEL